MNPKVDDCVCSHIRLQHSDKDGHCMVGEMLGSPCYCMEFVEI